MNEWHIRTPEEIARVLESDLYRGLSQTEANKRAVQKKNILFPKKQKSETFYAKQMMRALLPLLLLVTALAALLTEEKTVGYLLLLSLGGCTLLLFVAYSRARRFLETAEEVSAPSCRVIRDGRLFVIPCEELVRGDILLLEKGDFVPADCRLLQSDSLVVRESGITSHKLAPKDATAPARGDELDSPNMLWAGTAVEEGLGRAIVCLVGDNTYFFSRLEKTDEGGLDKTPLLVGLRRLSAVVSGVLLGFVFLSAVLGFFSLTQGDFLKNWMLVSSFAASAMAEFYGVLAYITAGHALYGTKSRKKALQNGTLLKKTERIDSMASLNRLFLTPRYFKLPFSGRVVGFSEPFGRSEAFSPSLSTFADRLLRDGALALGEWYGATPMQGVGSGNDTEDILKDAVRAALQKNRKAQEEGASYPLVSYGKTEKGISYGVILRGKSLVVTLLAKCEELLPLCRYAYRDGKLIELNELRRERILQAEKTLLEEADMAVKETYAVAVSVMDRIPEEGVLRDSFLENELAPRLAIEGFLTFEETLHAASVEAISEAKKNGVAITLFCESEYDLRLAKTIGIPLSQTARLQKGESAAYYRMGRKDKLSLVRQAREGEECAAFAGEELSFFAHMKEADLSLTMGEWQLADDTNEVTYVAQKKKEREKANRLSRFGCDAVRHSADMIVSCPVPGNDRNESGSGGFASLLEGINRAGIFFFHLRSVFSYLAFATAIKLILTVASLFVAVSFASPEHIALIGLLFDPLVCLAIVLCSPSEKAVGYRHDRRVFAFSLLRGLLSGSLSGILIFVMALLAKTTAESRSVFVAIALLALSLAAFLLQSAFFRQGFSALGVLLALATVALLVFLLVTQSAFGITSFLFLGLLLGLSLVVQSMAYTIGRKK